MDRSPSGAGRALAAAQSADGLQAAGSRASLWGSGGRLWLALNIHMGLSGNLGYLIFGPSNKDCRKLHMDDAS